MKQIIKWGHQHPKELFKIDGIGAIISAVLLGFVLVHFEELFGIPKSTLYFLALLPCFFACYDFYCYFRVDKKLKYFLKGIAFVNLSYCFLSIGLTFYHKNSVTALGWAYIFAESFIVILLAVLELKIAESQNI